MRRKITLSVGLTLLAALLLFAGSNLTALSGGHSLLSIASKDAIPAARSGASDALSNQWLQSPPGPGTLFSLNDGVNPSSTPEGRRTGLDAQVAAMVGVGDPRIGAPVGSDPQAYADAISGPNVTLERAWARSRATLITIRTGFAIVPGGAAEAFNRIQTCLNGAIQTNEGNLVRGISLDCSKEPMRRAMADTIAKGFYLQFGPLPVVGFDCAAMSAQAVGGSTVEARWAAAQAYADGCGPDLADMAMNGGSAELRFAAVAPLAEQLAASGASAGALLAAAQNAASSSELRLANAWAAGLLLESQVGVNAAGNPTAPELGDVLKYAFANFHAEVGAAAIAPLARFYDGGSAPLKLTIARSVPGASLQLWSFVLTQ